MANLDQLMNVTGDAELAKVFAQLPIAMQKSYMRKLVTKHTAGVRKTARRVAPSGKRTGTTAQKSAESKSRHKPLRRNIVSLKTRLERSSGTIHNRVVGPPQQGPLLSGHTLVAWGVRTGGRVRPAVPYMDIARERQEPKFRTDSASMLKGFIERDAANLAKKEYGGKLTKSGVRRLAVLREVGF